MAIDLTQPQLTAALRLGDSAAETAEATRLLAYVYQAIQREAPDAPAVISNEAAIRLGAYLYDQPTTSQGDLAANALRFSGAKAILLPYRSHRAGNVSDDDPDPSGPVSTMTQVAVGWSFDRIPLAAELTVKTTGRMLTIPVGAPAYLLLWTADRAGMLAAVMVVGQFGEQSTLFSDVQALEFDGLMGTVRTTVNQLGSAYENSVLTVTFL